MKFNIKNICCIGAGYVGGPSMAIIAYNNPSITVNVVDVNKERIRKWNDENLSNLPIFEPGLPEIINKCRYQNLWFSNKLKESIEIADMIFICVNTPTKVTGIGAGQASDLKWVEVSARQIAEFAKTNTIVVEKSTIPVKTAETIRTILNSSISNSKIKQKSFSVLSNPEFLSEGTAINDLQNPDRVLIGGEDPESINALEEIYLKWVAKSKIIKTNLWSSELSKLAANAFLAQRISSINSIASLCEVTGADINEVSKAIGSDKRIGTKFLKSGPGFGGSCFKKDILNLVYLCNFYGLKEVSNYWKTIWDLNIWQQKRIPELILKNLFGTISGKNIGILGFSFKANTNDTRESPAISICKDLIKEGANLRIYDPKVSKLQITSDLAQEGEKDGDNIKDSSWTYFENLYGIAENSDALVILTEWEEFSKIDWFRISKLMRNPAWLFDTRGIVDKESVSKSGMKIWQIGQDNSKLSN